MTNVRQEFEELYKNARTGEWIIDTEEAEIGKRMYDEIGRLQAALYGGAQKLRDACDEWEASGDDEALVNDHIDPWVSAILAQRDGD